jgi:hypothetical protein
LNGEQMEVVSQLRALFGFVYRNWSADMLHDGNRISDAVRILRMHRETWVSLASSAENPVAPASGERKSWET